MLNALKNNNSKFLLIGKIKGLANEARRARISIDKHAAKKNFRGVWHASYRKYVIGTDTRHHLLAYAFLRGTPYLMVEKKCAKMPTASLIYKVVEAHAPNYVASNWYRVTEESVKQWLNGEEV